MSSGNEDRNKKRILTVIKQMLTENQRLALYAKDKDNMVTTGASKTGLVNTLWQNQDEGNIKPRAYGGRYLNDTVKIIQSMNWDD